MPTPPFFLVKTRDRVLAVQAPGVNEIEEEVSATLLYFDFCCTIGIALFIPIIFELLNFHQHIVLEICTFVTKKRQGSLPSTRRLEIN